jgi:hypothetical protein
VRYRSKALDLAQGRNAIELLSEEEVTWVLVLLKEASLDDELDAQIEAASDVLRASSVK